MRATLSISVPNQKFADQVKRTAKKRHFNTTSEYIVKLLQREVDYDIITEEEILKRDKKFMQDYKNGKAKLLTSLQDWIE
jgi:hypothetical protein